MNGIWKEYLWMKKITAWEKKKLFYDTKHLNVIAVPQLNLVFLYSFIAFVSIAINYIKVRKIIYYRNNVLWCTFKFTFKNSSITLFFFFYIFAELTNAA